MSIIYECNDCGERIEGKAIHAHWESEADPPGAHVWESMPSKAGGSRTEMQLGWRVDGVTHSNYHGFCLCAKCFWKQAEAMFLEFRKASAA